MIAAQAKPASALAEIAAQTQGGLPVWIRAPKAGTPEFYSGLRRGKLFELAKEGAIRSVTLREPGEPHGTRLFHLRSILDFIEAHETRNPD